MKRKITYGILAFILLSGLYFGLRLKFGIFTPYNLWTAEQDIKNGEIQLIEIGEMPLNFERKQKLANNYGFNFYLFGCTVSTGILNGIKYYNKKMIEHLENKFGIGWWAKFENQLDSIDHAETIKQKSTSIKLPYKRASEIIADKCYSTWVELKGSRTSLALHFMKKKYVIRFLFS